MSATGASPAQFPHPAIAARLASLAQQDRSLSINALLTEDPSRVERFRIEAAGWQLDYSRHLLSDDSVASLLELARAAGVLDDRAALFDGSPLNHTEQRAVLHTLLRASAAPAGLEQEHAAVESCKQRMAEWVERVHAGSHRGHHGDPIRTIVNIGIGGSDLGPRMVVDALGAYRVSGVEVRFCANVDPDDLDGELAGLDPHTTLFIICSKTLRTEETLHNARRARQWMLDAGVPETGLSQHFLAVSTNIEAAREFGIPEANILPMWDWVGGRFSLWSAIGWSIAFAVGMEKFEELLAGAEAMDQHFISADAEHNMPLWLSLLEIWYVNFMGAQAHAVIPYQQHLARLPAFLQQLSMESNGKSVNHRGETVGYATAPILWGDAGTNGQHSFHQLLHQGTVLCPTDFVLITDDATGLEGKQRLLANGLSQMRALMLGRDEPTSRASLEGRGVTAERAAELAPHLVIPGNRPSSTLSCPSLTPHSLGALLALYEHKTFCSGRIWEINSFDQWGVELGKEMGAEILGALQGSGQRFDASTNAILDKSHHE
ncbi:MAG: glucose-6-phosphate isomerase [Halieaceae bacterium]|nr:glucose-6-phosphate isomerase [Halieaceae bacterium]